MKNHKKAVIILLTLLSSVSLAKRRHHKRDDKPSKPYKYYFTMPAEASLAEWAYAIPDCQFVSKDEYKYVDRKDNCQENKELKARNCLSRIDVELKNLKSAQKKKFGLNYIIFETEKSCNEAHAKALLPSPAVASAPGPATATAAPAAPAEK
jgi:hypothetical protein